MARCYNCGKEISLFWIWKKKMIHTPLTTRRYIHNILGLPFFYCPKCSKEIQPSAITMSVYGIIVLGGTLGSIWLIALSGKKEHINIITITAVFVFFYILGYFWWKFFGRLKEPHKFPWEKE